MQFNFTFNESHFLTGLKRYRKQSKYRPFGIGIILINSVLMIGMSIYFLFISVPQLGLAFIALAFLPLIASKSEKWFIIKRFRKSPFFNGKVNICISNEGFSGSDNHAELKIDWGAITKVSVFKDGFMFFSGAQVYYWCPNSCLSSGTTAELEQIINKYVVDVKYV